MSSQNFFAPAPRREDAWRLGGMAPRAPLLEVHGAGAGAGLAAESFALAWALTLGEGLILWAYPEHLSLEQGAPYAEGLAQYGAALERILCVCASDQQDALWAAEQALSVPGARALCTITPSRKNLSLTATRRLLLLAEKYQSHCILIRHDAPSASAAWLRFSVSSAPSQGEARELGAPAFDARLTRNRFGQAGQAWRLSWNAHEHVFIPAECALDGDLAVQAFNRSAEPQRRAV